MDTRRDQRGLVTSYDYDDRGLVLSRTTGGNVDSSGYDALGRMLAADRGSAQVERDYTDLGDIDYETQTYAAGTPRTVDYGHDQAGNRTQLTYPNSVAIDYTHTRLNGVKTMDVGGRFGVEYNYQISGVSGGLQTYEGRWPETRRTTTDAAGGDTVYEVGLGFDIHRRSSRQNNRLEVAGSPTTIADYTYTHDLAGNPLTQSTSGMSAFSADDRTFAVDDLDRLIATTYAETAVDEESWFDLLGNREAHIDRARQTFTYGAVNAANEYASIDGNLLTYDAAGNLTVDEDGRQYFYDEFNRLTEVQDSGNAVLVRYTYDALGRRVLSEFSPNDPPNAYSIRYVYDGQRIIEERDGADALTFYHVNGAQYIDERIATYTVTGTRSGEFTYYLAGSNYSVTGQGNSDGSVIERIDFGSGGDFANGPAGSFAHDAEPDLDIDLHDFMSLQVCFATTDPTCLDIHDFDLDGVADGVIDINDFDAFAQCMNGPEVPPLPGCAVAPTLRNGTPPPTGTFALHGRPIDVLVDGKVLLYVRARFYDPQHGRWFQRDRAGYADGANLYESFGGNPSRFTDPTGEGVWAEVRERRINLNGQELWAVEYSITENNLALGLGGQLYLGWNWLFGSIPNSELIERHEVGTEYFAYSDDPRIEQHRIASVESMRQIVEQGYIANRDVSNLRQGIIVLGTTAVALPVAQVAAPVAAGLTSTTTAGVTSTTTLGMITAGAGTGAVSLGSGTAFGHWLVDDSGWEIAEAAGWGTLQGAAIGGAFGAAARFDMNLTGPDAFKLFYGPWAGAQAELLSFRPPPVTGPAHTPVTGYTWNQVLSARYGAANVEWVVPKVPSNPLTLGVLRTPAGEFELASGWKGYGAMMPKGSPGFDIVTRTHVEGQAAALMQRQGITEGMLYMNNPAMCPSCTRNLPYMLGPGRTLQVYPLNEPVVPVTGVAR